VNCAVHTGPMLFMNQSDRHNQQVLAPSDLPRSHNFMWTQWPIGIDDDDFLDSTNTSCSVDARSPSTYTLNDNVSTCTLSSRTNTCSYAEDETNESPRAPQQDDDHNHHENDVYAHHADSEQCDAAFDTLRASFLETHRLSPNLRLPVFFFRLCDTAQQLLVHQYKVVRDAHLNLRNLNFEHLFLDDDVQTLIPLCCCVRDAPTRCSAHTHTHTETTATTTCQSPHSNASQAPIKDSDVRDDKSATIDHAARDDVESSLGRVSTLRLDYDALPSRLRDAMEPHMKILEQSEIETLTNEPTYFYVRRAPGKPRKIPTFQALMYVNQDVKSLNVGFFTSTRVAAIAVIAAKVDSSLVFPNHHLTNKRIHSWFLNIAQNDAFVTEWLERVNLHDQQLDISSRGRRRCNKATIHETSRSPPPTSDVNSKPDLISFDDDVAPSVHQPSKPRDLLQLTDADLLQMLCAPQDPANNFNKHCSKSPVLLPITSILSSQSPEAQNNSERQQVEPSLFTLDDVDSRAVYADTSLHAAPISHNDSSLFSTVPSADSIRSLKRPSTLFSPHTECKKARLDHSVTVGSANFQNMRVLLSAIDERSAVS